MIRQVDQMVANQTFKNPVLSLRSELRYVNNQRLVNIPISRYVQSRTSKFQVMGHQSVQSPQRLEFRRFHAIMPLVLFPHPQKLNYVSRQVRLKMQVVNDNQIVLVYFVPLAKGLIDAVFELLEG